MTYKDFLQTLGAILAVITTLALATVLSVIAAALVLKLSRVVLEVVNP